MPSEQMDNEIDNIILGIVHQAGLIPRAAMFPEARAAIERMVKVDENTSDGYHTFKELYEFRLLYNAALFNEWAIYTDCPPVVKSKKHSDGELCFAGGWFVVTAQLSTGQITNHYELKDWDLFNIPEVETAPKWDGHTPQDVAKRLRGYLQRLTTPTEDKQND
jgi:hypothetical protein